MARVSIQSGAPDIELPDEIIAQIKSQVDSGTDLSTATQNVYGSTVGQFGDWGSVDAVNKARALGYRSTGSGLTNDLTGFTTLMNSKEGGVGYQALQNLVLGAPAPTPGGFTDAAAQTAQQQAEAATRGPGFNLDQAVNPINVNDPNDPAQLAYNARLANMAPIPTLESIKQGIQNVSRELQKSVDAGVIPSGNGYTPINTSQLGQSLYNVGTPQQTSTTNADSLVAGAGVTVSNAAKSIADYEKLFTPPKTEASSAVDKAIADIDAQLESLQGRGQAQLTEEARLGLEQKRTQLANVNAQIETRMAEYEQLRRANENRPVTMNSIIGSERAILNAKAADVGLLQAQALGLTGQIEAAQAQADRAVDLKYGDIENSINIRLKQLELLQGQLSKEDERRAQAVQLYLNDQKEKLADQKAVQKELTNYAITSMTKYPSAGINTSDSYQAIQNKILGSAEYQKEVTTGGRAGTTTTVVDPITGETSTVPVGELTSPQKTRLDAINTVSAQLTNYRNLVNTLTGFGGAQLTGSQAAQLRTAKSALEFSIAAAVGTGALQAADREVVRDLLPDPTSISGAIGGLIRGGKTGNLAAIDEAQKIFDSARNTILGGTASAVGGVTTPEDLRTKYQY